MRTSLVLSLILHGFVLATALIGFSAHNRLDSTSHVAVDIVTPSDISAIKAGKAEEKADKAALRTDRAEKPSNALPAGIEHRPAETVSQKQAALPPPKPKALPPQKSDAPAKPAPQPKAEKPAEPTPQPKHAAVPAPAKRPEAPRPRREVAQQNERRPRQEPAEEKPHREEPRAQRQPDRIAQLIDRPAPQAEGKADFDPAAHLRASQP